MREYSDKANQSWHTCSASELPTVKNLRYQIASLNFVESAFEVPGCSRRAKEIERQLNDLISVVDGFYLLLGERGWVFSEALSVDRMRLLVEGSVDSDSAEAELIAYLKEGNVIRTALGRLNRYEDMRPRLPLLRKAAEDYFEGRYYSVVLVLIAMMDGFVNDSDKSIRRGLHARVSEEMHTEDCVATMWKGLPAVQATFAKSFRAREDSEVHSVFRHGIMHGMVTNFDNEIVASKAWCMLFAVCDWVDAVEADRRRSEDQKNQEGETINSLLNRCFELKKKNLEEKERIARWLPHFVDVSEPFAEDEELVEACMDYLDCWRKGNYGGLAGYLSNPAKRSVGMMAGEARATYSLHTIDFFKIISINRIAPAVAEVDVSLGTDRRVWSPHLRFVRVGEDGTACCDWEPGRWTVTRWAVDPFRDAQGLSTEGKHSSSSLCED